MNGGSIDVAVSGEDTSIRPGSWNTAKARDGTSGDLRDPIRVQTKEAGKSGGRYAQSPGLEGTPDLAGALRRTRKQEGSDGLRKRIHK
jgi:hypothetical protein